MSVDPGQSKTQRDANKAAKAILEGKHNKKLKGVKNIDDFIEVRTCLKSRNLDWGAWRLSVLENTASIGQYFYKKNRIGDL